MEYQKRLFFLLIAVAVLQSFYYYSQLPDTLASHFDSEGNPNGWSSKTSFFTLYLGMMVLFAGIFLLMPRYLTKLPISIVSLPNKEYWMAPERNTETMSYIGKQMLLLGNGTMMFFICIIHLVIDANMKSTAQLASSAMWILLGGFLAFTIVWSIRFVLRFYRVDQ